MSITKVTDWGSYIIPEEKEKEFDQHIGNMIMLMDGPEVKAERFDKKWGDYKIIPA